MTPANPLLQPPMGYFGGKTKLAKRIVTHMPAHDGYIEPFAGSLAVLLAKPQCRLEVANDLDQKLMTFWRVVRERTDEFVFLAECTPHSRVETETAHALDATDELTLAWQVWVCLTQGRARSLTELASGWRLYTNGARGDFHTYLDAYRRRIPEVAGRLRNVSLESRPALDVIERYGKHAQNLLYVDPPYLAGTRSGGGYAVEMRTETEHIELAEALRDIPARVMLSGLESDLYRELYAGWRRIEFDHYAGNSNADRGHMTEIVWCNFPAES